MSVSQSQSLSKQLTRKVLLLSIIGVLGLGSTIAVTLSRQVLSIQRRLEGVNAIATESFDLFFLSLQSDLISIAGAIGHSNNIDQNLRDLLARHPELLEVRWLDQQGRLQKYRGKFSNRLIDNVRLPQWLAEKPAIGTTAIGPILYEAQQPYAEILTPVSTDIGLPQGFLIARIDLTDLWDRALDIKVGRTGYAYLSDAEEHVITYRNRQLTQVEATLTQLIGKSPPEILNESLSIHRGLNRQWVFASAQSLQVVPWYSIVEQPVTEALAPFTVPALLLLLIIGIVFYLLQRVLQFTQGRISRPLARLSQAVAEMQQGDAIAPLYFPHDDEFKELAQLLTQITRENSELYESLEAKVRKRTEELEISNQKAEAANRAKSEFLAHMSHELRTPLNAILGFSQLLQEGDNLSQNQTDNVDIINRSGEHLLGLINNILEMSKIEASQIDLGVTTFDFLQFLNTLREMMRLKAQAKQLELFFVLSPNLPRYINADEGKLRQILLNLIGNGIKFTSQGEVKLEVSSHKLDSETHGYKLCFTIRDTGPGMDPAELGNLFTPFTQTRTGQQSQQGTGLGLCISQQFAQLMGSEIMVESQLGQGSQFYFALNVTAEEQEIAEQPGETVVGLQPSPIPYRLLVVDDQWEGRALMVQRLSGLGFEVKEVASGEEAIQQQQCWSPHLIWMDIRLPGISGLDATQQIKQQPNPPIIIALTANAFCEDREEAIAAGCDDFVAKPCTDLAIWQVLHHHLKLEYQYISVNSTDSAAPFTTSTRSAYQIGLEQLRQMSPDWHEALKQAAQSLSEQRITRVIEKIPKQQVELHNMLTKLVADYRYDQLLEMIASSEQLAGQ